MPPSQDASIRHLTLAAMERGGKQNQALGLARDLTTGASSPGSGSPSTA
ncbi:hypothetical protein [Thermus hydrothermalis]|nr:hypothetical protein [Thermus hydrothermalis]